MYLAISWKVVPYNCHEILDLVPSLELIKKKKKRLQWFDQFEKKWKRVLDLVSLTLRVSVSLLRGRPKQTWNDVNRCDLKERKVIKDLA